VSAIVQRHLDAIAASMALLNAQIEALRHAVNTDAPKRMSVRRLDRCADIDDRRCGLCTEDARKIRSSFSNPGAWTCVGCGYEESAQERHAPDSVG
jgi:hypothetical protein